MLGLLIHFAGAGQLRGFSILLREKKGNKILTRSSRIRDLVQLFLKRWRYDVNLFFVVVIILIY